MREKVLSRRNVNRFMLSSGNKLSSILRYMASREKWTVDEEPDIRKKCNEISFDVNDIDTDKVIMLSHCLSAPRAITLISEKSGNSNDGEFMSEFERKMLYLGECKVQRDAVRVARSRMIFLGRMNMLSKVFDSGRRKSIINAIKRRNEEESDV